MSSSSCWKPPISIRNNTSLPPSISFVVAEPQQTHSLPSAAINLPTILRRAMPPVPESSQLDPTPISISDCHELSSTIDNSPQSPPLYVVDESTQSMPVTPLAITLAVVPRVDQPEPTTNPSTTLEDVSQHPAQSHSLSNKRSWLDLFYWSSEKAPIAEVKVEVNSHPPDAVHIPSENIPKLSTLETIQPAESTIADGDSSPRVKPQSLPIDALSRIPRPALDEVDGLSACDEQPVSQFPPGPLPDHSPTRAGTSPPVASNNAAPSIFTLSFPMLTKSRPRPEITVTLPPQDLSAVASNGSPVTMPGPQYALNSASINVTDPNHLTSTVHVSECDDQSVNQSSAETEIRMNTWWTYLGWNANVSAAQVVLSPHDEAQTQSVNTSVPSVAPERPCACDPIETQPEAETKAPVDSDLDVGVAKHLPPDNTKLPSVQDAEAATIPLGSTWYAPWYWYQPSSSAVATTVSPDMRSVSHQDPPHEFLVGPKAEAKQSTGDHEGHSVPDQVSPSPRDLSATGSVDYNNPIQSVISANHTGWMSFFTAKAIAMKSITAEEDGEMEVMEIDDEMAFPESKSLSLSTSMGTQLSSTPVTKPPIRAQLRTIDTPPPPSLTPRKTNDKRPRIPPAVPKSETVTNDTLKRQPSPSPSKKSGIKTPTSPPPPNLVLPTWHDTFHALPRSVAPREPPSVLSKTLQFVSGVLFSRDEAPSDKGKGKAKEPVRSPYNKALPRTWDVLGRGDAVDVLRGCKRVVIIGVHGWFPGAVLRTLAGEPTGTSAKFVSGIVDALDLFQEEHKVKLDKVTKIPLEGEGTINRRVERLYQNLIGNKEWVDDLHDADAIFVATHSQGSVVSTHLLDRLIADCHIRTTLNADASVPASDVASGSVSSVRPPQRICCLALCGIHLGPLRYLSTSSLVQPYIQYFESTAARELFEFQNTESPLSRDYVRALRNILNNGTKMVYIASLNDQVVGLYSGLFTSVSHPLILRALYVDGDAYHPSDFLSHLLVLLLRIRNAGLSDGGLLTHLSEVTAGSLNGIGHSTPYEERATYSLAINYLFLTNSGSETQVEFVEEPFNALAERNDYEIPWALRDLTADDRVISLFSDEIVALRDAFRNWHPKTSILRDVKRKLQPIQRLSSDLMASHTSRL